MTWASWGRCCMPKFNQSIIKRQMLFDVLISTSADSRNVPAKALFDTGATCSCITARLAKNLCLTPVSKNTIFTANGTKDCNTHMINVGLQFPQGNSQKTEIINGIVVVEIDDNPAFEMIVGMDIIQQGILIVDGGNYIFSI